MDHDEIREALQAMRARDLPTHGGRTLAYVYDSGLASWSIVTEIHLLRIDVSGCHL